jgi:hypothetical protein
MRALWMWRRVSELRFHPTAAPREIWNRRSYWRAGGAWVWPASWNWCRPALRAELKRSGARVLPQLLVLGVVAVLTSSCATRLTETLWEATDPGRYVAVPQDEVSEIELREQGVSYYKDNKLGLYYVEKTGLRRIGDWTVRFFATPVALTLDAAPVIVVVGAVLGAETLDKASDSSWTHWW